LRLKEALAMTAAWYQSKLQGQDMRVFTSAQIEQYETLLQSYKKINSKRSGVHG
jgi:hypothetical protein